MEVHDITDAFTGACSKLKTGQLVKDEHFTLFESVSALEIMDSKMDSGYLGPGETLKDDYDVFRELLPEEVVGIMDQLLCQEVAWHTGHPLSLTLFTSIYLDRLLWPVPNSLAEARFDRPKTSNKPGHMEENGGGGRGSPLVNIVLRAYCLALIKACDRVHTRVTSEYYYEEEDFVTQLYNRKLLSDTNSDQVRSVIDEALSWLDQQGNALDEKVKEALSARLLFRRHFLSSLDLDTFLVRERCTEPFQQSLRQITSIKASREIAKPVEEAFSSKIQRRLASTVPPRPMVNVSFEDALLHMTRLCQDAIDVQELLEYKGPHNLLTSVWALHWRNPEPSVYVRSLFQSLIVHKTEILGSVSVKDFLYNDLAELVLPYSQILDPLNEEIELPSDPRFQIVKQMDAFVQRAAQPFVDSYRTTCLNRCRVRRNICHAVIDWDNLQVEAEDLDVSLQNLTQEPPIMLSGSEPTHAYPLSSWALHHKLRQLRLILQLGFELSVYSPEELGGMYWYLSHICSTHLSHLDRIRSCVAAAAKRPSLRMSTKRKREEVALERQRAFIRTSTLLDRLTTELVAIDAFAIGLHALYVVLSRHKLLPSRFQSLNSPTPYSSPKLRYELRMKPFLPISLPEIVPFEVYEQEATLAGDSDTAVLNRAARAIAEAKRNLENHIASGAFLEVPQQGNSNSNSKNKIDEKPPPSAVRDDWTRDMKDTLRACIGASIAVGVVKKALAAAAPTEESRSESGPESAARLNLSVEIPEVGDKGRWHSWWAVPRVSEVMPLRPAGNKP